MLRVTDDRSRRPLRPIVGGLAFALLCACTLIVSAWRFPGRAAFAGPPAADEVAPFDLSLVAQGKDQDGFYGIRPAALLNRPAAAPLRRLFNREIDTYTAPIEATGLGIHIEDVEQIMGRVMVGGENKPGKRTVMLSLNVVRMTHDMEWAKLRDQCGTLFKKHEWHGETYVSFPAPQLLSGITGIKGDMYLWAADARTLVQESPAVIKKLIEAKVAGKKLPVPAYTTGWNTVSRGLFAIALDNRGGRITKRCIAHSEMKDDTLKDVLAVCRHTSHLVAGCAGDDDLSFQLCAIADSAEAGAELAEAFRALIAMGKALSAAGKVTTDTSDSAARTLLQKAVARTTVRQSGNTVTIRAEAPSGFNALLAAYAKEAAREKH